MSDFNYLSHLSSKNKRHFVSQKVFVFHYVGKNNNYTDTDIVKELGSLFSAQSFDPFEIVSNGGRYAIHVLAKHKNIRVPVSIWQHPHIATKDWYCIGVSYGNLGSKFEHERLKLEDILEKACMGVAGKPK